jgi:hypothetical protein
MDRRQASVLVAAALSTLFGCGYVPKPLGALVRTETRKTREGVLITRRDYENGSTSYQRAGGPEALNPHYADSLVVDFEAAGNTTAGARSAAAAEREKLVPAAPTQQTTSPAGVASPVAGPKVDLPAQIYQPPSTPPTYQPPSGYHH